MILTSCAYKGYTGDYVDLYSVAINSVLWLNGHSWGADFECDPQIEILEEDQYGRILFTYYEKHYAGSDISFVSLIISQPSSEQEVLYYEDVNYLVKEQVLYSPTLEPFSNEEIEYLKSINDWNKEVDYAKCVKKEITKIKSDIPHEEEIKNRIVDEFDLVDGKYSLFMDFLTHNSDNSKYIVYGYIRESEQEKIYFIGLVEDNDFIDLSTIVPSNVYDYKAEFIDFKKINDW
jgi:hypothetical protein